MMDKSLRVAAITPYHNESRHLLQRCIDSVNNQTAKTDHFLIADGIGQDWIDKEAKRHIKLGKSHIDFGNTPRGLGALLAASEGYEAIFYLDADNWIQPDHVQACVHSAIREFGDWKDCDYVVAKRLLKRPDQTTMHIAEEPGHVDTNCYFFFPGTFHLLSIWVNQPKYLSSLGDRFFYQMLKAKQLNMAANDHPTVNYHCMWASLYRAIGETPPPGAKENINNDFREVVKNLSRRELEILFRLTGGLIFKI
jgi:glycosyltransferase involved in cell wall biosynthesis